jgi:hypothetical protein
MTHRLALAALSALALAPTDKLDAVRGLTPAAATDVVVALVDFFGALRFTFSLLAKDGNDKRATRRDKDFSSSDSIILSSRMQVASSSEKSFR